MEGRKKLYLTKKKSFCTYKNLFTTILENTEDIMIFSDSI